MVNMLMCRRGTRLAILGVVLTLCSFANGHAGQTAVSSEAMIDNLRAMNLAVGGSKPEALLVLAQSLRLQPERNPAAALAFELLTELRTNSSLELRGHTGGVLAAAYSPDGTKIATGSQDGTARIWDAHTGMQLAPPLQAGSDVGVVAFSPDGTRVATGSEDGAAQIWDVATGQQVGAVMKETDAIKSVRFSPDGKWLATGADNNYARMWDAATGKMLVTFPRYHDTVFSAIFSPDGKQVLLATGDGHADVLDPQTGKLSVGPMRHKNNVMTAVYSADGTRILTGSADNTACVWQAKTGKLLATFTHGHMVCSAAFNANATRVVTASWDHTARVWNVETGKAVTPPLQHGDSVVQAIFSPDGKLVATASRDHTARVWDATTGEPVTLPLPMEDEATSVAFDPTGKVLLVASKDKVVHFWDMPPSETPPAWLADLAAFGSTQVRYDASRKPDHDAIVKLRAGLLASNSSDPWEKFGRWYFAESDVRPISPWSTVSLQAYVDNLTALGDLDSLNYAIALSQDRPAWTVKLVKMRNALAPATPTAAAPTDK